jgi:large subunit ribosomal protein L19
MAHLMQRLEAEREAASLAARPLPDFRPGDALELRLAIAENRDRPATLRGVCIARKSAGWRSTVVLLSHIAGGGSVVRSVPLHSPSLQEVRVLERARVKARRAKLYYLAPRGRGRAGRNPKEWRV